MKNKRKIKMNWHAFMDNSSEVDALYDFICGKSLNAIANRIWSLEAKRELKKAKRLNMKSARIGALRVLNKYYIFD